MNKIFKSLKLLNDGDLNKVKGGSAEVEKPCDNKGFTKNCGYEIQFSVTPCLTAEVHCPATYSLSCGHSGFTLVCPKSNFIVVKP